MVTLALLLALLLSFSGSFLWFWMVRTRQRDSLLYGAVSLVLIVNTVLLTLYHFDEFVLFLAARPDGADAMVTVVVALKLAAKGLILALLFRRILPSGPRGRGTAAIAAAAWMVLVLLPLPAWVGELAFLGGCAVALWRLWPGPLVSYVPLKALVVLIDALVPPGLSPFWGVGLDLGFYLGLNLTLHRWVLGGRPTGSEPLAGDWAAFDLSPRERETADLLVSQLPYKDIAARLFVSVETVKSHAKAVYRKTGCRNRQELGRKTGVHPGFPPEIPPVRDGEAPASGTHSGWRQH